MAARRSDDSIPILHDDANLLVVDKPVGLTATPGKGGEPSVADRLVAQALTTSANALRPIHRLDRDASGVLVFARDLQTRRALLRQLGEGTLTIEIHAIVNGYVTGPGEIDLLLAYDRRRQRVVAGHRRGRPATTRYRVIQRLAGHTLLACAPQTDQPDQVRAHLAGIGHPLSVDPLYGGGLSLLLSQYKPGYRPSAKRPERPLIDRLTLHAHSIDCVHPRTREPLTCTAPPPKDFRATITQLGRLI